MFVGFYKFRKVNLPLMEQWLKENAVEYEFKKTKVFNDGVVHFLTRYDGIEFKNEEDVVAFKIRFE